MALPNTANRFAILALLVALMTLASAFPGLQALCDDYYYYERIARNIIAGHGSTFDGVVQTNGYQPLWMVFILLAVLLEQVTRIGAHLIALALCAVLAAATIRLIGREIERDDLFATVCLVAFGAYGVFLAVMGMEATLAVLLGSLYFLELRRCDHRGTLWAGVLLGLCFLARIDSPVYFFPGVLYVLSRSTLRAKVSLVAPLMVTVVGFCLWNAQLFGVPVPVSGLAKSVTAPALPHWDTWTSLVNGTQSQLMVLATVLLTVWALVAGSRQQKLLAGLSFVGLLAFFVTTSIRSDWMVWPWYQYPLALNLAQLAVLGRLAQPARSTRVLALSSILCAAGAFLLVVPRNLHEAARDGAIREAALELRTFFANRPDAVLAMGDRAGMVGEYLPNRLVQLEGLVMDKPFLDRMHQASSITPVLQHYAVDYYIATNPRSDAQGCFITVEPAGSHGYSHRVTTQFCQAPAKEFWIDGWHTVVFQTKPAGHVAIR